MRRRNLARLLAPALLSLAAARPAGGQPCTLTCPPDVTVPATGVLTPVGTDFPVESSGCGTLYSTTCSHPDGFLYPIGTTTVICALNPQAGPPIVCEHNVTVVRPTELDVTFTEAPFVNPNPGTSILRGASFSRFDVFSSSTDQLYIFEDGQYVQSIPTQGFVAFDAAPTDTGVKFIGRNASDEYGTAQIDLCGGAPPAVQFATFAQQDFDFSQGVFWNGNSTGLICGATPADGKVFRIEGSLPPFYGDVPSGSHVQDVFIDGNACVALVTGNNGIFRAGAQGTTFTSLPFTPGSGTVADFGDNFWIGGAVGAKLYRIERDGTQVAEYNLSAPIFRISLLPNGDVFGLAPPRTFVIFDPDFGLETSHVLSGTGNNITDFKPGPGYPVATTVFLNDPTVGRSFVREMGISFVAPVPKGPVARWHEDCLLGRDGHFAP